MKIIVCIALIVLMIWLAPVLGLIFTFIVCLIAINALADSN